MNKRIVILSLPLLLLVSILAGISGIPSVHAANTALVCYNDASAAPATGNPCPAAPGYTFDAPFPSAPQPGATQARIGVYVNGSQGMDGFDITILRNHLILGPSSFSLAAADLSGSILNTITGPPVIVVLCVDGQLVTGSTCAATDSVDTIHFAATTALGAALVPETGLLFTAVFNVTGTAPAGGIPV